MSRGLYEAQEPPDSRAESVLTRVQATTAAQCNLIWSQCTSCSGLLSQVSAAPYRNWIDGRRGWRSSLLGGRTTSMMLPSQQPSQTSQSPFSHSETWWVMDALHARVHCMT